MAVRRPSPATDQRRLAQMLKALGNPVRFGIVEFLAQRKTCITADIVDATPLAQSTVSQHLKVLREAGLIQGEIDPPYIKYCIHRENWAIARSLFNNLFK